MAKKIKLKKYKKSQNTIINARRLAMANSTQLIEAGLKQALSGSVPMTRFFLEKIIGKDNLDIGIETKGKTAVEKANSLLDHMATTGVTESDIRGQAELVKLLLEAKQTEELEKMLNDMEDQDSGY